MNGKIDLFLTKSVSRFTCNTVDALTHVLQLKDAGVEAFFEKENIWTLDSKDEYTHRIQHVEDKYNRNAKRLSANGAYPGTNRQTQRATYHLGPTPHPADETLPPI